MRYYSCRCGYCTAFGSMGPHPCESCPRCGSDLAIHPECHKEPAPHDFSHVEQVLTDEGNKSITRCRYCMRTKEQILERTSKRMSKELLSRGGGGSISEMWRAVERPGYLGKKRDELYNKWNKEYEGHWRIVWQWGSRIIERREALQMYEDAYYEFLRSNPDTLLWLISTASDVYDTDHTNVLAGFDYNLQETSNNHIHDVAIRRAVLRLGCWFEGGSVMHVRGKGTEGERLSPHLVPFHRPTLILDGNILDYSSKGKWWRELGIPLSVEEFYQHNKILQKRI